MNVTPAAPPPPDARALQTRCAAVVVHYRDAEATLRCLASLRRQDDALEVVLVDNASPDGSGRALADAVRAWPNVTLLTSWRNGGFGAGCNFAFAHAITRWPKLESVLLLNPDAELHDGALRELRDVMARRVDAGVVGCRIEDERGEVWFENGRVPEWTLSGSHCAAPAEDEFRTRFVTGACMLVRAELLRAGLRFDESFFLYCEDMDLCREVQSWGFELWITARAHATHRGGGSQPGAPVLGELTAERLYWLTRAKVLFARKRLPLRKRLVFLAVAAICKPLVGALAQRSLRFVGPYLRALRDGLRAPLWLAQSGRQGLSPAGRWRS